MSNGCIKKENLPRVLTIAGSDCSGGAGIQADLKTMLANGVYGMSAITALTAQNTTGVYGVLDADADFVAKQISCVFDDIRPDAVKIGMVSNKDIIKIIADKLTEYNADNIVLDPVMVSTSGSKLITDDAIEVLINELMPIATVITPNIPEAMVLTGMNIESAKDMEDAAKNIAKRLNKENIAILIKGGHSINDANDLLYTDGKVTWISGQRVDNNNTHGTGCTLSSAIASNLAKGYDIEMSVKRAKDYIAGALMAGLDLGNGSGPLSHGFDLKSEYVEE